MKRYLNLVEPEPLPEVGSHLLEECRMVLPGIQALFGFQFIAIFNEVFTRLPFSYRVLHLAAMVLVGIALAFVMAPAAYHRQAHQFAITRRFIRISSDLVLVGMIALLLGLMLEVFLVASVMLENVWLSGVVTGILAMVFISLWFGLPWWDRA